MNDPWRHPGVRRWMRHVETDLHSMIDRSKFSISLCPPRGKVDAKYAVELGMCIMLEKPLFVVAPTNDDIPAKLRLIADYIIIGDWQEPDFHERIANAINSFVDEQGWNDEQDEDNNERKEGENED